MTLPQSAVVRSTTKTFRHPNDSGNMLDRICNETRNECRPSRVRSTARRRYGDGSVSKRKYASQYRRPRRPNGKPVERLPRSSHGAQVSIILFLYTCTLSSPCPLTPTAYARYDTARLRRRSSIQQQQDDVRPVKLPETSPSSRADAGKRRFRVRARFFAQIIKLTSARRRQASCCSFDDVVVLRGEDVARRGVHVPCEFINMTAVIHSRRDGDTS